MITRVIRLIEIVYRIFEYLFVIKIICSFTFRIFVLALVITQWYCSYHIVLSFDVWLHCQYTWEKQLLMYIGSAIGIGFFLNNEYRISEKFDISTPLFEWFYIMG